MAWLITGGDGQLAKCLADSLRAQGPEFRSVSRAELDISDADAVTAELSRGDISAVINTAAYTAVDKAESDPTTAEAVNAFAPGYIAKACSQRGIPLVHISTDYVFSGDKQGAYSVQDETGPVTVYGNTKLAGEAQVQAHCPHYLIIRTAWVLSEYGHNFLKTMLRLANERDSVSVVNDQYGNPTDARDLADAIVRAIPLLQADASLSGVYHFAGDKACTWQELARTIFAEGVASGLIPSEPTLTAVSSAAFPTPAKRPANSQLDSSAFTTSFGIKAKPYSDTVSRICSALAARSAQ